VAKADPKNSDSIATIQEEADALARHIENSDADAPKKPQPPPTPHEKHLGKLEHTLRTIAKAKDPKLTDSELQAQAKAIRIKLVRRIENHRSSYARFLHYGLTVDENSDRQLYYIRLTGDQLKIGQRRGSKSRAAAREEAAAINDLSQLNVIEQRALDIFKGARRKPRKNLIEMRAIRLADATKEKFFSPRRAGRPKGAKPRPLQEAEEARDEAEEARRAFDALKPRLALTDLVSIAAPIIEKFAGKIAAPIVRDEFAEKKMRPNNAFMALRHTVYAYSETPPSDLAIQQALNRVRSELRNTRRRAGTVQSYVCGRPPYC